MGIKKLLSVATFLVAGSLAHTAWAQTDVTSTYLKNADFSSTDGWTVNKSAQYSDLGNGQIGTYQAYAGVGSVSTVDATHLATEFCFGFECRWQTNFSSYYQETSSALPVGHYTLSYDVENTNSATTSANYNNMFTVKVGETTYTDESTEWMKGKSSWTTHSITFVVKETATATISLGYGTGSNNLGSPATPVIHVSHLKLIYTDFLTGAKTTLQAEIDAAKALEVSASEKTYLDAAIATAESVLANATTEAELAEATAALKNATLIAKAGMTLATAANPIVTDFVVNGTFDSNKNGWTATGGFQNNTIASNQQGAFTGNFWENWNGSAKVNKMYQDIKNIPNGTYQLSICAFVNKFANESQYVFANNDKTYLTVGEPTAYEVFTVVTNNTLQIGLEQTTATANWMGIDNVVLKYYGEGDVIEEAKNAKPKADWTEALTAATAAINDAKYANVTGAEKTALQAEIAKEEPTTADGYIAATTALTDATSAFINAAASYDSWVNFKTTFAAYNPETFALPYASAEKKTAFENAFNTTPSTAAEAASVMTILRAYIESNGMAEGVDGAADYTSNITNASEPTNTDGWTVSNVSTRNDEGWTNSEGISTHSYFDGGTWGATGWTASMKQDVTIPAGRYLLTAIARSSAEVTFTMSVGEATVNLPNAGNAGNVFDRGWNETSLEFTTPGKAAQETVTIQINATTPGVQQWFSIGNFRLVMLEATEIINASEAEYAALKSAIDAAEAKTLGFEAGEYAPYNNVATLQALAAAKAIDPASDNTAEVVVAATTALNEAIWTANETDVDAIYNGHFATVTEGANYPDGWARTNAWGQMRTDVSGADNGTAYYNQPGSLQYGNSGVYTMPLAAETYYRLTFKYRSHEEGSNNGVTVSVLNGEEGLSGKTFDKNASTSTWAVGEVCFKTGAAGNYTLTLANNGNTWMTDVTLVKCVEETVELVITEAGMATVILPFEAEIPAEIKAYTCASVTGDVLDLVEAQKFEANTPYLVEGAVGTYEFTGFNVAVEDSYTAGLLTGNLSGHYIYAPMNSYILLNGENGIGFYRVVSDDVKVNNNRVYLTVPAGAEAKAFISFGDATSINGVTEGATEVVRYNAAGVKVNAPVKGLNIVKMSDGTVKKVMVK